MTNNHKNNIQLWNPGKGINNDFSSSLGPSIMQGLICPFPYPFLGTPSALHLRPSTASFFRVSFWVDFGSLLHRQSKEASFKTSSALGSKFACLSASMHIRTNEAFMFESESQIWAHGAVTCLEKTKIRKNRETTSFHKGVKLKTERVSTASPICTNS